MRMEPDEIDSAADEHGDFDSYYRGFLGGWLFRWLRSRKPLANASRRRPLALSSSKRCDLEHFAPLPAALRPSRPVQQWVFHQAERKTPAEIQLDLDRFLEYYNLSHQGYR